MLELDRRNSYFDELFNTPDLIWLGQNTNHFALPPAVKQAMLDCIETEEFHAYAPPAGIEALRELILADAGLAHATALVTDGAIEGLYHACRTLARPGDQFITTDPGWKWPIAFAKDAGATVVEIPIYGAEYDYRLQPERLAAAVTEKTRLIYLVDPNNPLGICYTAGEIEAFAGIAREAGAYLIHDCTYWHFADGHTLAANYYPEKTLTTYSFSKWLGIAGLRVGAIIGDGAVVEALAEAPPNNLGSNVLSQRAAIAGLKVKKEWFPDVQRRQRANQARIKEAISAIPGLAMPVYPSNGNFVVVDVADAGLRPEALCDAFRDEGIMIRQAAYHTERFRDKFVKISTTVPEDWIERLCALFPEAVEVARGLNRDGSLY
jgi:aspartate/methionine/tyrosine aminotransferase